MGDDMGRLIRLSAAAVALLGAATVAQAADLPVKAPPMAPAPVYSWTGVYVGASVGGEWERIEGNFVNPPPASWSVDNSRGFWDAHIGAQYQWNRVVFGVEGNFIGLFHHDSGTDTCHPAASCAPGASLNARLVDDIWTIGGRLGVADGAWMGYVSGGYANARVDNNGLTAVGTLIESTRTRHDGAYVGVGFDWQIWTRPGGALVAGIEYRHYEFQSVTATPTFAATGLPNVADTWSLQARADTVEGRLSWLFNWGGPVVAKY